jgi:hypothetical protein
MAEARVTVGEFLFAPYVDSPPDAAKFLERLGRRLEPFREVRV